jgi:ribose transport system permease protein
MTIEPTIEPTGATREAAAGSPQPEPDPAPIAAPVASAGRTRWPQLRVMIRFQSVLGLVLVFLGGIAFSPRHNGTILFLTGDNLANIVRSVSETGIIAVGMTFVIIAGGIDLSVGAVLGLAGVLVARLMIDFGWGAALAIGAVLVAGLLFGLAQGVASTTMRIQAFVVTLAGLQLARGLARIIAGDKFINISYGNGQGQAPASFSVLGDRVLGQVLPVSALIFLAVGASAAVVLNTTRFGRHVFAVGGNERAARLSGISVRRVKIATFAICGMTAALSGILDAGQLNFANPNSGAGYELAAIAAVVIGGTSLFGGEGTVVGTLAGALLLGSLNNILQLNNVNANLQLVVTATIIVAAAALQNLAGRRRAP